MTLALGPLTILFSASEPRQKRVRALATLVMLFAAGALVTSTVGGLVVEPDPAPFWDAVGGAVAVLISKFI
jgi:hypothetical protein